VQQIDLNKIVATARGIAGLMSVVLIVVALSRAMGFDPGFFKMNYLDIAALSVAAAFVSKST